MEKKVIRPHSKAVRQKVLNMLDEGRTVLEVSEATGINRWTIRDWRKAHEVEREAVRQAPLVYLRQKMIDNTLLLVNSLEETLEQAPLNHRVAALTALIDKLIKLEAWSPPEKEAEQVIRIEYQDPDGTRHATPPWTRGNYSAPGAIQGDSLRTAIREDGSGQDRDG